MLTKYSSLQDSGSVKPSAYCSLAAENVRRHRSFHIAAVPLVFNDQDGDKREKALTWRVFAKMLQIKSIEDNGGNERKLLPERPFRVYRGCVECSFPVLA